jgi:hypothetical protein
MLVSDWNKRVSAHGLELAPFLSEFCCQPFLFLRRQPRCGGRSVPEVNQHDKAEDHGWDRLGDEDPLPPGEAQSAVELQQRGRDRATERNRDRGRHREPGDHSATMAHRKPIVEIREYAGEEAGFRGAEQKAQSDKADRAADKGHRSGQ